MSRSAGFSPLDCVVVKSLDDARMAAGMQPELMVIGGSELYRQCLPLARRIHLTLIHTRIEDGDTLFGGWRGAEWHASSCERHEADAKNAYATVSSRSIANSGKHRPASIDGPEPGQDFMLRPLVSTSSRPATHPRSIRSIVAPECAALERGPVGYFMVKHHH